MQQFGSPTPLSAAEAALLAKRRFQSRSDEEIETEMDNRRLNYRHGWPLLPPLPVQTVTRGATLAVHNAAQHLGTVQDILLAQRIHPYENFFAYRVPNDASNDEPIEAFLTLVVTVNTAVPVTLVAPIVQLRQYLKTHEETRDIFIELIDYRAIYGLFTFPIRHEETAILGAWDQVSNIAETEISNFHEKWLSMELLHRGLMEHQCSPTVVITSPSAGNDAWTKAILPAIRQRLRNLTLLFDLEVMCANTLVGVQKSDTLSVESYAKTVAMGSSIGIPNDKKHAGTVGGFVTLSDGKAYGLTNHHVVRDGLVDEVIKATNEKYLKPGQIDMSTNPRRFNSPADRDHTSFIEQLKKREKTWENQKNKGNALAATELTTVQTQLKKSNQSSHDFGTLFASSGPRVMERPEFLREPGSAQPKGKAASTNVNFLLDWALLEIVPSRSVENRLPNTGMIPSATKTHLVKGQLCNTWTPLDSGKTHMKKEEVQVAKHGRTTGYTLGTINSALTKINPKVDSSWENFGKVYHLADSTVGVCYSIIRRGKYDFVDSGDCGSVVLHDETGTWLGLLFGQNASGSGLMLPMDLILKDIENVTGLAVTEPRLDMNPS